MTAGNADRQKSAPGAAARISARGPGHASWGWRPRGCTVLRAAAPAGAGPLPVVTAGGGHSCALMPDQTVWCWGQNTTGQLGDGTATDSLSRSGCRACHRPSTSPLGTTTPARSTRQPGLVLGQQRLRRARQRHYQRDERVPGQVLGIQATQVSAGDGFTCAVTLSATVDCWGDNNYGELGDGTTADASTPQPVTGLTGVTQVAAGVFPCLCAEDRRHGLVLGQTYGSVGWATARRPTAMCPCRERRERDLRRRGRGRQLRHRVRRRPAVLGREQRRPARHRRLRPTPAVPTQVVGIRAVQSGRPRRGLRLRDRHGRRAVRVVLG